MIVLSAWRPQFWLFGNNNIVNYQTFSRQRCTDDPFTSPIFLSESRLSSFTGSSEAFRNVCELD